VPQAEAKRHAITCTTLNDIVQSLKSRITAVARSGASGIAGFELNQVRRQRRNDVAASPLARIPDRFS
jgi:hypothetical protein